MYCGQTWTPLIALLHRAYRSRVRKAKRNWRVSPGTRPNSGLKEGQCLAIKPIIETTLLVRKRVGIGVLARRRRIGSALSTRKVSRGLIPPSANARVGPYSPRGTCADTQESPDSRLQIVLRPDGGAAGGPRYCGDCGAERVREVEHLGCDYVGAGRAERQEPARGKDGRCDFRRDTGAQADGDGGGVADAGGPGSI